MKKLIIVGTKADSGKGGISTALTGYIEGLEAHNIDYEFVVSHDGDRNSIVCWIIALVKIKLLALRYRSNAVFWFHCGPWLSMTRKFTLAVVPRILGAKTIAHIHSPTFNQYINGSLFTRFFLRLVMLPYSKIVALTPWWKSLMQERGIEKPIIISPNPNNSFSCQIAKQYLDNPRNIKSNDTVKILTMARMVDGKGIETVISAFELLPEHYTLTIAGDGVQLEHYQSMASLSEANDRIEFTGWIDGEQKHSLMSQADIFCLPSTYDSFGMVFIEAMAYDLPVIAYGWGPINDVVTPEVGECCQSVSATEVADKIKIVAQNRAKYSGFGPNRVLTYYTPEQVAKNIIEQL
ncbi:glycosyltransferase family 4 protein [Thalassotalea atypica]|uniref:glycosyltransferase family 4 protein n=1 Tax=Thalassotalea atypica TaxID=2054316 RepID=UPI0025727E6E|nr:glycosyltransferase family 4 protein [Thalassotalea atypica]